MLKSLLILFVLSANVSVGQSPVEKSKLLFENKQYAEAKAILSCIGKGTEFAEAQYYLGRIATQEKNYEQAVRHFENATNANPNTAEYHNWLGVLYGVVAMDSNPVKQALLAPKIKNEFLKAATLDPTNIQTQWGLVHYYTKAPGFLGGSWQKAFECATVIAQQNQAQGLCARAFIYESQGNIPMAKSFYQNSLQLDSGVKEASESLKRLNR